MMFLFGRVFSARALATIGNTLRLELSISPGRHLVSGSTMQDRFFEEELP